MDTANIARSAADKIASIASSKGISINKMLSNAGLDKSVVDRMKRGTMPSVDKIATIATELDVPTDFLMGSGVFSKWDLIISHKNAVLSSIAGMMSDLSVNLKNGVDDATFAKLVLAFSVDIDIGGEPAGTEILVISPFSVHEPAPTDQTGDFSNISNPEIAKAPVPEISENGREMLSFFEELPPEQQRELIGEARVYHRMLSKESGPMSGVKAV